MDIFEMEPQNTVGTGVFMALGTAVKAGFFLVGEEPEVLLGSTSHHMCCQVYLSVLWW